ncbi:MAG: type II secretion system protein GspL, partial [Hyphomonadaceae bacterium]|nr:type II secretion system protein GspL [Hyphomonadaceae bacterium]
MSSAIVAMAGASPEDPLLWFATDSSGRPNTSGEGLLADLASAAGNARIHLLLPGHLVTAHEAHLPSRSEREALIAAPYAIEDQIANDLDDVHLVLAPLGEGGGLLRTAYVVDKSLMEGWIAATRDVGLKLDTIGPDYLALPDGGSTRMVVADLFDRTLLRHG